MEEIEEMFEREKCKNKEKEKRIFVYRKSLFPENLPTKLIYDYSRKASSFFSSLPGPGGCFSEMQ